MTFFLHLLLELGLVATYLTLDEVGFHHNHEVIVEPARYEPSEEDPQENVEGDNSAANPEIVVWMLLASLEKRLNAGERHFAKECWFEIERSRREIDGLNAFATTLVLFLRSALWSSSDLLDKERQNEKCVEDLLINKKV